MKTTVDIADSLLASAKKLAARRGTTLRALVETGLRHVLKEDSDRGKAFRLRDESYSGRGLQPEFRDGNWERMRDAAYQGRGG
jgi:Arc/MetJ family transcription regulator